MGAEYVGNSVHPCVAAATGFVDAGRLPPVTRRELVTALAFLDTKRDSTPPKKHGNIPL